MIALFVPLLLAVVALAAGRSLRPRASLSACQLTYPLGPFSCPPTSNPPYPQAALDPEDSGTTTDEGVALLSCLYLSYAFCEYRVSDGSLFYNDFSFGDTCYLFAQSGNSFDPTCFPPEPVCPSGTYDCPPNTYGVAADPSQTSNIDGQLSCGYSEGSECVWQDGVLVSGSSNGYCSPYADCEVMVKREYVEDEKRDWEDEYQPW